MKINPYFKNLLGFSSNTSDKVIKKEWELRVKNVCKPCWELKYCPYGPLVEQFPLLPPTRKNAIEHNQFLKEQLKNNKYKGKKKIYFEKEVINFNPKDYSNKHDKLILEQSCMIFGHLCPIFFVNEPFTETREVRSIGRRIKRSIILRVSRRDNNQCQICGSVLLDSQIEFDHIIPISKGGSSEENNIQVTCLECNRKKTNKI